MIKRCVGCGKPRQVDYAWLDGCCDDVCLRASQQTPKPKEYRDKNMELYLMAKFLPVHTLKLPKEETNHDQ